MIKKVMSIGLLRKIPVKKTAKKCVFGVELAGALGASAALSEAPVIIQNIAKMHKPPVKQKKTIDWITAQTKISDLNKALWEFQTESHYLRKERAVILKIMQNDKNISPKTDKDKVAGRIIKIAREYGADPVQIACIAKEETHFTENLNGANGKGMMQITKITVKDMFERPGFYHEKLKNITSKYKNYTELYKDLQNKPVLNLRIGVLLYQARLKEANGNIRKALVNYNGSSIKNAYAERVLKDIQKYQKISAKDSSLMAGK